MSNSLFENPKIALGFAGAVVAIALVASVALDRFSSGKPGTEQIAEAEQTQPASPNPQQVQNAPGTSATSGWANEASASSDWGAPVASSQNGGFAQAAPQTNDAPVWGDYAPKRASGGQTGRSGTPTITTSAAPGAPEVVPPRSGRSAQIEVAGN